MNFSEVRRANMQFHALLAERYREQPFFREENQQRVRALLSSFAAETGGASLLDVGCGSGFILDLAHDLFGRLEGIDITPEMLARVTPRPNVRVQLAPAEALPFADATFDVVTLYSVLHHLPDLAATFAEARRVLRPGGILYADESPSQHFISAISTLVSHHGAAPWVAAEASGFSNDASVFLERYGIDPEITRAAMIQNYGIGGLTEENLRRVLAEVGFGQVNVTFRRFMGESELKRQAGEAVVEQVNHYLTAVLPASRCLFKFFVLVAKR